MERIENQLKAMICERFNSVKEFASAIELPYTTVDSILKRGVDKANVINIIKICTKLGIDVDALASGNIQKKYVPVKISLVDEIEYRYGTSAREALDLYIQLDSHDQGEIRGEMKQMLKHEKYSLKEDYKHA